MGSPPYGQHSHHGGPFGATLFGCTCGDPDAPHPSARRGGFVPGPDRPLALEPCQLPRGIVRVDLDRLPPHRHRAAPVERALAVAVLVLALVVGGLLWRCHGLTDALRRAVVERPAEGVYVAPGWVEG